MTQEKKDSNILWVRFCVELGIARKKQHPASAPMHAHGFKMNPQAAVIPIPMH